MALRQEVASMAGDFYREDAKDAKDTKKEKERMNCFSFASFVPLR
jgi:hypothetical protein